MKKYKSIAKAVLLSCTLALTTSCNDFLDKAPDDQAVWNVAPGKPLFISEFGGDGRTPFRQSCTWTSIRRTSTQRLYRL